MAEEYLLFLSLWYVLDIHYLNMLMFSSNSGKTKAV